MKDLALSQKMCLCIFWRGALFYHGFVFEWKIIGIKICKFLFFGVLYRLMEILETMTQLFSAFEE